MANLEEKYKPNSYRAKAENEKEPVKPVVSGATHRHQKTVFEKMKESFFGEEVDNVGEYVLYDVIIPSIKELMSDAITKSSDMLLFGETRKTSRKRTGGGTYVAYNDYSSKRDDPRSRRSVFDFSGLEYELRPDAVQVLRALRDEIDMYGHVEVAKAYEYSDIVPNNTDYSYGWFDLDMVEVYQGRDGLYRFRYMPKPRPLR